MSTRTPLGTIERVRCVDKRNTYISSFIAKILITRLFFGVNEVQRSRSSRKLLRCSFRQLSLSRSAPALCTDLSQVRTIDRTNFLHNYIKRYEVFIIRRSGFSFLIALSLVPCQKISTVNRQFPNFDGSVPRALQPMRGPRGKRAARLAGRRAYPRFTYPRWPFVRSLLLTVRVFFLVFQLC